MGERATRRWGVVLAVLAVVSLGTAGFVLAGRADTAGRNSAGRTDTAGRQATRSEARAAPQDATSPDTDQVPARPSDAIDALLRSRAAAVRDGDRQAWLDGLLSTQAAFVKRQAALFDRIRAVRPREWRYQVAGGTALPPQRRAELGGRAWLAEVQLGYRLTDTTWTTTREQYLTVVLTRAGWRIAADTDGPTARDVWDLGPVTRVERDRCVVLAAAGREKEAAQVADECDPDAARVDRAWGTDWPRRTVLVVPASKKQLATLLPDSSGLDQTAAVTVGPADGAADGVLVNADALDRLSALGRRVVVTHELVHVAVRAAGARYAPTWLSEGFADHVAYTGTGLTPKQIAGGAVDRVRARGIPKALPADADFAADQSGAEAAYDESWVAVGVIAKHTSVQRLYRRAGTRKNNVDRALRQAGLGGTAAFIRLWQAELRRLA